jgi:hypothetical protein
MSCHCYALFAIETRQYILCNSHDLLFGDVDISFDEKTIFVLRARHCIFALENWLKSSGDGEIAE